MSDESDEWIKHNCPYSAKWGELKIYNPAPHPYEWIIYHCAGCHYGDIPLSATVENFKEGRVSGVCRIWFNRNNIYG